MIEELTLTEKLLAHQRQAERMLITAALIMSEVVPSCAWLMPEDMVDIKCKAIWNRVRNGSDIQKAAIDEGVYSEMLMESTRIATLHNYDVFIETIRDDIYYRGLVDKTNDVIAAVIERKLDDALAGALSVSATMPPGGLIADSFSDAVLDFGATMRDTPTIIPTCIPDLDHRFGGFSRGTLTLLAARPSMGKTSLALQIAADNASQKRRVLYISIEMTRRQLITRLACGLSGIDSRKFKTGHLSEEDYQTISETVGQLTDRIDDRLFIDDRGTITDADIWQAVNILKPDLLIVDHLGLVKSNVENMVEKLGAIAWTGKQIAKAHNLAAIYLMQLSRSLESRDEKRPALPDLRGSGELEQNADVVLFIHRDDYYKSSAEPPVVSETEILIAKEREGARNGKVTLTYNLLRQSFYGKAKL